MAGSKPDKRTDRLFRNVSGQDELFERSYEEELDARRGHPVECLGLTFDNEDARRTHFTAKLKEGLEELHSQLGGVPYTSVDDAVARMEAIEYWPMGDDARLRGLAERMRHADSSKDLLQRWKDEVGFPHGEIEDILNLSDPPWHTACPNPFIQDFIHHYGNPYVASDDAYHREPFAADVTEGKSDPIYNAHSYHTKVPHKAIMRYIKHYTRPGDLVFDGFCGTGMTGVAAALSTDLADADRRTSVFSPTPRRWPILIDLSPLATFIASNLLRPISAHLFTLAIDSVCTAVEADFGSLYTTSHNGWRVRDRKIVPHKVYQHNDISEGILDFTLYSDVVQCPECTSETTLYSIAVDERTDSLRTRLRCPFCDAVVTESKWEPVFSNQYDPVLGRTIRQKRIEPVLINYTVKSTRFEKLPDAHDRHLLGVASQLLARHALPPIRLIEGTETRRNESAGVTHLHHFFTPREHLLVAALLKQIQQQPDDNVRKMLLFSLTATLPYASRMRRFRADRKGGGPLSGTLYIGSLITPPNVLKAFRRNAVTIRNNLFPSIDPKRGHIVGTQDSGYMASIPNDSIDYIFTDPPFGHNFNYSELNFFWEGLLAVTTNQRTEAIISTSQDKSITEYGELMEQRFREYYRILKPGRWMTVEFSNTKASVWNAIQSALEHSGFVVATVASLDKKQHSFKAVMTPTAMKQDLIISAYKPNGGLEDRFRLEAGTDSGAWDFIRTHLGQLPIFTAREGKAEVIAERQNFMLFDRMVAFHVRRRVSVPMSAGEFYSELAQRFPEREGMYFLPDQVIAYDKRRMAVNEVAQLEIFVVDESSAIQWLKRQLIRRPRSFQDIHPQFLQEIAGWRKHEKLPELSEMLDQNFLCYDGTGEVPSQVHSYLSTNFKELRNLPKDHSALRAKANRRWYVPDPNKAADVEMRRTRALLREFDEYRQSPQKRLKLFRLEAVRAGFFKAYREQDYGTIISVAEKIPESVLQEDQKLMLYYDTAVTRSGAA